MAKRVSFSGEHLELRGIAQHFNDLESSLRLYFSADSPVYSSRFATYTASEVTDELRERLHEADLTSCLTVLAAVEAAFRIDYLQRCYRKEKDPVSRAFREIHKAKQAYASLEEDIFQAWINNSPAASSVVRKLGGVFKFRHWLAHGRYWIHKSGRYDFTDVFLLAELTFNSFPFYGFRN